MLQGLASARSTTASVQHRKPAESAGGAALTVRSAEAPRSALGRLAGPRPHVGGGGARGQRRHRAGPHRLAGGGCCCGHRHAASMPLVLNIDAPLDHGACQARVRSRDDGLPRRGRCGGSCGAGSGCSGRASAARIEPRVDPRRARRTAGGPILTGERPRSRTTLRVQVVASSRCGGCFSRCMARAAQAWGDSACEGHAAGLHSGEGDAKATALRAVMVRFLLQDGNGNAKFRRPQAGRSRSGPAGLGRAVRDNSDRAVVPRWQAAGACLYGDGLAVLCFGVLRSSRSKWSLCLPHRGIPAVARTARLQGPGQSPIAPPLPL